jgi:hypothetical protein
MIELLPPQQSRTWIDNISPIKDAIQAAALIVGAIWTYFKFFRGRTFTPRLELNLACQVIEESEHRYLSARIEVKNVGLSRVSFDKGTTALKSHWSLPPEVGQEDGLEVRWSESFTAVSAFGSQLYIDGGEAINETLLLELIPVPTARAYKVVLEVNTDTTTWSSKTAVIVGTGEPNSGNHHWVMLKGDYQ